MFLCVSLASFFVLFLRFSFLFLPQYSVVLYARDGSYVHCIYYAPSLHCSTDLVSLQFKSVQQHMQSRKLTLYFARIMLYPLSPCAHET